MDKKNDLKEAYKLKKFKMGVFQIRNTVNQKIYIESGTDLDAVWNRNRFQLNFGSHQNAELQKDWQELGEAHFRCEILAEVEHKEGSPSDYAKEVKTLELMFIEDLKPFAVKGYHKRKL